MRIDSSQLSVRGVCSSFFGWARAAVALTILVAAPAVAGSVVEIKVSDPDGRPLAGATVFLSEVGAEAVTGSDGACRFQSVAPGRYHVVVKATGFAGYRGEIVVADDSPVAASFSLSGQVHFSETVTVSPHARDTFESYQPTTVLAGEDLDQRLSGNLGDTLGHQVGVNARAFGPGPSRPVIRGLDGDRVLVLENGARTGDLSSQSADHGVTLDPATATQIEVVRGPATLLYGSNALGGVVNIVSDEIPTKPVEGAHGAFTLQGGTGNAEGGLAGNLGFGNGSWALRVGGAGHRSGDVTTPEGELPNSQSRLKSGGGAVAFTGDDGYAGVSYQYVDTLYGVPFVEEGETTLNPRRHRLDFRTERRKLGGVIEGFKLTAGYRNYKHDEIEGGGEIATSFRNEFVEGQLLLNHRPFGKLKGTLGVWGTHRDYSSAGAEALAPPTTGNTFAAFFYEELPFRHVTLQFGGRVDRSTFSPDGASVERPELTDRDFTEYSGSAGLLGYLKDDLTLALNVARAARNPSLEELFNFGPHAGNFAFEIGNPDLDSEKGLGLDLSLRYRSARFTGEASVFRNSIDNFIFAFPTGDVEDDLPVVSFRSADSVLQGFEAHADIGLTPQLWLELGGDAVRGELRDTDEALPRIPPLRGWAALRFERDGFHVEGELRGAAKQDRVYGAETPTAGYTVVNLHASYSFTAGKSAHSVTLRLDNTGDRLYRNHLSYIKDLTPEMGRSLKAVYSVRF